MTIPVIQAVKSLLVSRDAAAIAAVKDANEGLLRCKAVSGTVYNDKTLSNLSIQYANPNFIGMKLMPMVSSDFSGKYATYGKRDRLSGPDDNVGSRSTPNEIAETRTMASYACTGYALMDFVDDLTLKVQDAPLNEMVDLTASVNDVLDLKEEIRIAAILTAGASFPSQTVALAGGDQWSSPGSSDPVKNIQTAIDATWTGAGATKLVGYCSNDVLRALQRHPAIADLFKFGGSVIGIATPAMIAGFFGLDELLVSDSRYDTANIGATASYSRIWGKVFGVVRVATNPSPRTAAFGYTFRHKGERLTSQWFDQKVGTRGGYYAKVGMEETHVVTASDTGYLITAAIA